MTHVSPNQTSPGNVTCKHISLPLLQITERMSVNIQEAVDKPIQSCAMGMASPKINISSRLSKDSSVSKPPNQQGREHNRRQEWGYR